MKLIALFCLTLAWFSNSKSYAWWDTGHMVIAKIAYDQLTPNTKTQVDLLVKNLDNSFPESAEFVTAACFADDIKQAGLKAFNSWHICSFPYDPSQRLSQWQKYKIQSQYKEHDVRWAILQAVKTLKSPKSNQWAKGFMLRFLIHCVGDIHQPLHCASLYNDKFPFGDHGGNGFIIKINNLSTNLHAFWDSICGIDKGNINRPLNEKDSMELQSLAQSICLEFPSDYLPVNNIDVSCWQTESYELAATVAYQDIKVNDQISETYIANCKSIAKMQVALAGYRLGYLLNSIFEN